MNYFILSFALRRLFTVLYSFFPTKSKFRKNLIKTEQLFIKDLKYQFKKIIRKNGKYSSGIYGKKGLFQKELSIRIFLMVVVLLKLKKNLLYKKKNLSQKMFFNLKNFFIVKKFLS